MRSIGDKQRERLSRNAVKNEFVDNKSDDSLKADRYKRIFEIQTISLEVGLEIEAKKV